MKNLNKYILMLACSIFVGQMNVNAMESGEVKRQDDKQIIKVYVTLTQEVPLDDTLRTLSLDDLANLNYIKLGSGKFIRAESFIVPISVSVTEGKVDLAEALKQLAAVIAERTGKPSDKFDIFFTELYTAKGGMTEGPVSVEVFSKDPDEVGVGIFNARERI